MMVDSSAELKVGLLAAWRAAKKAETKVEWTVASKVGLKVAQ